jgi:hypothetical protein
MKLRCVRSGLIVASAILVLGLLPPKLTAQDIAPGAKAGSAKNKESGPRPRTADGKPDFNGVWTGGVGGGGDDQGGGGQQAPSNEVDVNLAARSLDGSGTSSPIVFNEDNTITRRMSPNRPLYKPQYWTIVQHLDQTGNSADPSFSCMPPGVPRMGPPRQIVQNSTSMVFLYTDPDTYRDIHMDGRAHSPKDKLEGTWKGESIGSWEGDTLVIDTIGLNDESWLDIAGYIHGENMHVVERMHREGDSIIWQATVDDPDYLLKPWTMDPRTIKLNRNPRADLEESLPCIENDAAHIVGNEHH